MAQNVVVPPFDVAPETVVGSTPQSVFPFDFPFWNAADIIVRIDGAELLPSAFTVEGFFIQNGDPVEGGFGSGRVTLNTPVANCTVTLDRFVVDSREAQFGRSSPLPMPALNADLNKATARDQDLARWLRRAIDEAGSSIGLIGKADTDLGNVPPDVLPNLSVLLPGITNLTALATVWLAAGLPVEAFGVYSNADPAADYSAEMQDAIDWMHERAGPLKGGRLLFGSGIYNVGGLQLKERVELEGQGEGATILRLPNNANTDMITVSENSALCGIFRMTLKGNRANNTSGSGIVFSTTGASDGSSYEPYNNKVDAPPHSYKHFRCAFVHVGDFAVDGVYLSPSNYACDFSHFTSSHNGRDGVANFASDCGFSNFYIEKNGRCGLYSSGSNNKFTRGKVIWNGMTDPSLGGLREQGSNNSYVQVESQDNYCDGILVLGIDADFDACSSNTNGRLSPATGNTTSGVHADWRFGGAGTITYSLKGCIAFSYQTAPGPGGQYIGQYAYYFNGSTAGARTFDLTVLTPTRYNAAPNIQFNRAISNQVGEQSIQSSNGADAVWDSTPKSPNGLGSVLLRLFRQATANLPAALQIMKPGTTTVAHSFDALGGNVSLAQTRDAGTDRAVVLIGSTTAADGWKTPTRNGGGYWWISAAGKAMVKAGATAPTSDTDGQVVGTQT